MDADPELEPSLVGYSGVSFRELLLNGDGALDGIHRAGEFAQDAIASGVSDPPAMLRDMAIHDLASSRQRSVPASSWLIRRE
jgi:hypothetical protein